MVIGLDYSSNAKETNSLANMGLGLIMYGRSGIWRL